MNSRNTKAAARIEALEDALQALRDEAYRLVMKNQPAEFEGFLYRVEQQATAALFPKKVAA